MRSKIGYEADEARLDLRINSGIMPAMDDTLFLSTGPRPVRADAARNHDLLLETARQLFDEHGVSAITMSQIAQAAGVGKGTLYRHFADKAALCHALLDEDMRAFQEQTLARLMRRGEPRADLRWFLEQAMEYGLAHADLLCEAAAIHSNDFLVHPAHAWWRQTIFGLLQRAGVAGDLGYLSDVLYILIDVRTLNYQERSGYNPERMRAGLHQTLNALIP